MKISELIAELQWHKNLVGDVDVVLDQSDNNLPWFCFEEPVAGVTYLRESNKDDNKDVMMGGKFYAESWSEETYDKKVVLIGGL